MNLTDNYFPPSLITNLNNATTYEEYIYFVNELNYIMNQLYSSDDFCITGSDVCTMLDLTEHFFFLEIKDKLDYVVAPKYATKFFSDFGQNNLAMYLSNNDYTKEEREKFLDLFYKNKALARKKIFIKRQSLYDYLLKELKIEYWNIQIVLLQNEYPVTLSKIKISQTISKYLEKNIIYPTSNINITKEIVEKILNREIVLSSGKTVKKLIQTQYDNPYQITIHNTQLYRFLKNKVDAKQFTLLVANERPIVRYAINQESLKILTKVDSVEDGGYIFSIPFNNDLVKVKSDILELLNTL